MEAIIIVGIIFVAVLAIAGPLAFVKLRSNAKAEVIYELSLIHI